ncbi:MAG TPA: nucleotide sugar dehydrogenase [Ilumatobacter sp.]|nr:nucleotide sugar dehydrogenase [Ilumatobacter sp.]
MKVCVVALGKIGLPLAVQYARAGMTVTGADVSQRTVDLVSAGRSPFPGERHLDEYLADAVSSGRLTATTDTSAAVAVSEVVVVVVPLVVDARGAPDFTAIDAATAAVAKTIRPGTLVLYETTLPVGTTRTRFAPALEAGSGLRSGVDIFVAFSPERVFSGRIFEDLARYPKLVGGLDPESTRRSLVFYNRVLTFDRRDDLEQANGVWDLGSAEAAELSKLAETTYRDINIAFANELARFADRLGIDINAVIDGCNSQPFSHIHRPGIAVGGHCIPVYPRLYLSNDAQARLPLVAREVNESMPDYAVERLSNEIGGIEGCTIAVLGAAYRGGVKEVAFSGVFRLVDGIKARGGRPVVHDPLFDDDELRGLGFDPYRFGDHCDAAIVQADHAEYRFLDQVDLGGARVVLDGRAGLQTRDLTIVRLGAPTSRSSASTS